MKNQNNKNNFDFKDILTFGLLLIALLTKVKHICNML